MIFIATEAEDQQRKWVSNAPLPFWVMVNVALNVKYSSWWTCLFAFSKKHFCRWFQLPLSYISATWYHVFVAEDDRVSHKCLWSCIKNQTGFEPVSFDQRHQMEQGVRIKNTILMIKLHFLFILQEYCIDFAGIVSPFACVLGCLNR